MRKFPLRRWCLLGIFATALSTVMAQQQPSPPAKSTSNKAPKVEGTATAGSPKDRMIRLAKLEIDSSYLEEYKTAIRIHTKAALIKEPGVLTLYAMYDQKHPTRVTILEIYADRTAYEAHLKTAHFQQYKTGTLKMVKSLELVDVDPIAFSEKPDLYHIY